jgi:hypothetical protein
MSTLIILDYYFDLFNIYRMINIIVYTYFEYLIKSDNANYQWISGYTANNKR